MTRPDVEKHCYEPMDRLLGRQRSIQKRLFEQSAETSVILYDITSTYFEGQYEDSELVRFGYNRDGQKGQEAGSRRVGVQQRRLPIGCRNLPRQYQG